MRLWSRFLVTSAFALMFVGSVVSAQDAPEGEAMPTENAIEAPVEVASNVQFFRSLNDQGNATIGDGYRLAHILYAQRMDDKDGSKAREDMGWYRTKLIEAGIIDSSWSKQEGRLLTHIGFAYLCMKAAGVEGGVMWSATGHQRYAHREMVDRGLFPHVNPRQYISGSQALAAYRTCRNWVIEDQRRLTAPIPAPEPMPEEASPAEAEGQPAEGEAEGEKTE
ncbi:MAG: hypothetical protein KDB07_07230 [Planctomycetes bacterium]|nr:hypothetical protein [Planctomycetota bacterium]